MSEHETPAETTEPDDNAVERACAWSDYRKDYGVSANEQTRRLEHKAFCAGWEAARGQLDAGGPLR